MSDSLNNPAEAGARATEWTKQVVDNLFEAEKKWIELATQQNELVLKTIREIFSLYQAAPNSSLADWARQGVESFVEAQRKWLENATLQQNTFLSAQGAKLPEFPTLPGLPLDAAGLQQPMEFLAEAQKRWLDFAAQQSNQLLNTLRVGMGDTSPTSQMAEWSKQAVDNYVEVQKRWLNLATQWFPRGQ